MTIKSCHHIVIFQRNRLLFKNKPNSEEIGGGFFRSTKKHVISLEIGDGYVTSAVMQHDFLRDRRWLRHIRDKARDVFRDQQWLRHINGKARDFFRNR